MDNRIIIGNALGLIAAIIMVLSGLIKKKKPIIIAQTAQCLLFVFGNLF